MAVSKAQARAFFGGGTKPTITDAQFDKINEFLRGGDYPATREGFADFCYDLVLSNEKIDGIVEAKLNSIEEDKLVRVRF